MDSQEVPVVFVQKYEAEGVFEIKLGHEGDGFKGIRNMYRSINSTVVQGEASQVNEVVDAQAVRSGKVVDDAPAAILIGDDPKAGAAEIR